MHYREFAKSKSFGNRLEREIFSNCLGYKAHQFQRSLLAMQHLLQNILKILALDFLSIMKVYKS